MHYMDACIVTRTPFNKSCAVCPCMQCSENQWSCPRQPQIAKAVCADLEAKRNNLQSKRDNLQAALDTAEDPYQSLFGRSAGCSIVVGVSLGPISTNQQTSQSIYDLDSCLNFLERRKRRRVQCRRARLLSKPTLISWSPCVARTGTPISRWVIFLLQLGDDPR